MRKSMLWGLVLLVTGFTGAQQTDEIKVDATVEVRLVLLETLVLDGKGRTVTGLTRDDFGLTIDGDNVPIKTLDEVCPLGVADDATPIGENELRGPAPELPRRIVLLLDYFYLAQQDRARVIDELKRQLPSMMTPADEFMIAAIAPRLRVEQRFTNDPQELLDSLDRMFHDATLFAANLRNATGAEYLDALTTLMDVLEPYDGAKAVVMYSAAVSRGDVTVAEFEDIARRAASARTIIFSARAAWMQSLEPRGGTYRPKGGAGGTRILPVLTAGTGGRLLEGGIADLSLPLARAQRDLGCRHTIGFHLPADQAERSHDVGMWMRKPGLEVLYPLRMRLWSEDERRESRLRAAFVDAENFEHALVRAAVFPLRPSGKGWDTLVTLHFPLPNDGHGNQVEFEAALVRPGAKKVETYSNSFSVDLGEGPTTSVTILADSTAVRPGPIELTIALSRPGRKNVVTTVVSTEIPPVPRGGDFLLGPVLARVLNEGVLIRADREEEQEESELDRILSQGQSIEPLLVHDIKASDQLLIYWQACSGDKKRRARPARVERTIYSENGEVAHRLEDAEIALEPVGKLSCGGKLDTISANTLVPGRYRLEISIVDGGETITSETTPLMVH